MFTLWRVWVSQTSRERKIRWYTYLCFPQSDQIFHISLPATSEGQIVPTAFGLVWVRFWFRFHGFTVLCGVKGKWRKGPNCTVKWKRSLIGQGRNIIKQAEVGIKVITYIEVHRQKRQKRAKELLARTQKEGQNQKVNIMVNTTGRPNINNTQDKTNTGRRSHKIKTEKTLILTWTDENINTRLTGHVQGHGKQARLRKEPGKRKQE